MIKRTEPLGFAIAEATTYVQVYPVTGNHIIRGGKAIRPATDEEVALWHAWRLAEMQAEELRRKATAHPDSARDQKGKRGK